MTVLSNTRLQQAVLLVVVLALFALAIGGFFR